MGEFVKKGFSKKVKEKYRPRLTARQRKGVEQWHKQVLVGQ
jgi:hypothetical protein